MTSPSKPRRKKSPEVLDWRELTEGPALRGLSELLGTTIEVARDRADRRQLVDGGASHVLAARTVVERPTVGGSRGAIAPEAERRALTPAAHISGTKPAR